jgi:hypothetical protein
MNQYAPLRLVSPQTTHLCSASPQSFKSALVLFSTICSFGYGLSCTAHSLQEKGTVTSTSTFSNAIDSYHHVNTLYNGTINGFSTLAQSNRIEQDFLIQPSLKQDSFHKFVKAIIVKVSDHESRSHWTLTNRCNLPQDTKSIKSIWSYKRKQYLGDTLNKHKTRLCAHSWMQTWGQNYWETYAPAVN